jgi:MFS family permease
MVSDEERNTLHDFNHKKKPPLGLQWRSNTFFIISTVAVGMLTDLCLYCLLIPVLPFLLQDRLKIPHSQLQSYSSGLLALFAGASLLFSPVAGVIADQMSTRQTPFLFGLFALFASTILLAVGQNIPVLVIARILQGMSGAVVWTIGLAICLETVGPSNLGTTIGSV